MKTHKIKKVLIALDYDPTAQKVAEAGFAIGKAMNAEVILLHVISDPLQYLSMKHIVVMGFAGHLDAVPLESGNFDALKKTSLLFLDKSRQYLGDTTIQTLVREGDVSESVLKVAEDLHVDIIVLGSHSRKGLGNIVMGSVTEKVLQQTSLPLVIIPTKQRK
jgi:nucleotide-binding universal stress UspA family protein